MKAEVQQALVAAGFMAIAKNNAVDRIANGLRDAKPGTVRIVSTKEADGWVSLKAVAAV